MIRALFVSAATVAAFTLTGCGGSAVDASCDLDGITDEVGHMLEEAYLTVTEVTSVRCSGAWATATVQAEDEQGAPSTEEFLFEQVDGVGWVMRSAPDACLGTLPQELRDIC